MSRTVSPLLEVRGGDTLFTWGSFSIAALAAVTAAGDTAPFGLLSTTCAFGRFWSGKRCARTSTAACESEPGIEKESRNGLPAGAAAAPRAIAISNQTPSTHQRRLAENRPMRSSPRGRGASATSAAAPPEGSVPTPR